MTLDEAVAQACEASTLPRALAFICVWEHERAVAQAKSTLGRPETCFETSLKAVIDAFEEQKNRPPQVLLHVFCDKMKLFDQWLRKGYRAVQLAPATGAHPRSVWVLMERLPSKPAKDEKSDGDEGA
jgi:hypothetical protein